jgi:hypothetical protein
MFKKIKEFFLGKAPEAKVEEPAPYKVESPVVATPVATAVEAAPTPAQCGCGRSSTGLCVGLHKLTAEEWATHADNPTKVVAEVRVEAPVSVVTTVVETPAKPKAAAKPKAPAKPKAAAIKAPAKKKSAAKKPKAPAQS